VTSDNTKVMCSNKVVDNNTQALQMVQDAPCLKVSSAFIGLTIKVEHSVTGEHSIQAVPIHKHQSWQQCNTNVNSDTLKHPMTTI